MVAEEGVEEGDLQQVEGWVGGRLVGAREAASSQVGGS